MADSIRPTPGKAKKEKSVLLEGQVILSTSLYGLTGMLFIFIDAVRRPFIVCVCGFGRDPAGSSPRA